jgi:septal ring factor EnvC (AmiA/AmiB activator)
VALTLGLKTENFGRDRTLGYPMKNFLQNLLIFFSLCLCAMMIYQWTRETDLRKSVQELTNTVQDKTEAIQNLQAAVKRDEAEIQRLDGIRIEQNNTIKTNQAQIASLTKDLEKANTEIEKDERQIEAYKEAVKKANENILQQNEEIKKQNEEMKKLAEERNEIVKKFNKMAADYNDLATKWNQQQEELQKTATNAPPKGASSEKK